MYLPKPFNEGYLAEEDGHKIYFAEYGNPEGRIVLSLHGGPGSQSKPKHAERFDLEKYRIVTFDQRGCGKSEYHQLLHENTTQKLVNDIERLRERLSIEHWFVAGSSWGSTLALAYAEEHPKRVSALLLSAIFTADRFSLEWFLSPSGAAAIFTDAWQHRAKRLASHGIANTNQLYEKLLTLSGNDLSLLVADVMNWESNLMTSSSDVRYLGPEDVVERDIEDARIFFHYEVNDLFLDDDQLLNHVDSIKTVPLVIVHGRHDIICPFKRAWDLAQAHGNAKLVALPQSNHLFSADGEVARGYIFDSFMKDCSNSI